MSKLMLIKYIHVWVGMEAEGRMKTSHTSLLLRMQSILSMVSLNASITTLESSF